MYRLLSISSALALAVTAPAFAQQADPMATPPAPEAPITAEPQTSPAPTPEPQAPAAAEPREATVAKLVESEFPSYDADKNGELSQPEFTNWVMALHSKAEDAGAMAKKLDSAAKTKWANDAFASADADKSKKISKTEMSQFLLG